MKVILTGGGTGGHVYPAVSVARALPDAEILFIGTAEGPEATIVPREGFDFHAIPSRKMSRKPTPANVLALGVAAGGLLRAVRLLREWRPDVVIGTGGYASFPVSLAARWVGVPVVVHEANSVPGRTNRFLARWATRVALTFEAGRRYFPAEKTVVTGLPIRPDIMQGDAARARAKYNLVADRPTVFAFGGSQGAQSVNRALVAALPELESLGAQVLHQTGPKNQQSVLEALGKNMPRWYHPVPYVDPMSDALAAADLIICRGGASTLAEVTAVGLPSIVVPLPTAVGDHQTHNARALVEAGAAVLLPDAELSGTRLANEIAALIHSPERRRQMAQASRSLGQPEAASKVADLLRELAGPNGTSGRARRAA